MKKTILFLLVVATQVGPTYRDVVALENRALSSGVGASAESDHRGAIEIAQSLRRPRLVAVLCQRLGRVLERRNVQDAVVVYESGLRALNEDRSLNLESELNKISTLGKGYIRTTDSIPADLYSQPLAQELETAEADPLLPVQLLIDIGNAYFEQPQLAVALDRYKLALARPEIAAAPKLRAYALANSGEILRRQGSIDEAERTLGEAIGLLQKYASPIESRRGLALLAGIYRDRGRDADAAATYAKALDLYTQANDPRGEGRTYGALGRLHLQAKRFGDARTAFSRAIELGKQSEPDKLSLWHAYWGLGQAQRATGDAGGAEASFENSLDIIEGGQRNLTTDEGKVTLLDSVQDVFDDLIALYLDDAVRNSKAYDNALKVAERARAGAMRDLMPDGVRSSLRCPSNEPFAREEQMARGIPSPAAQMARGATTQPREPGPPDPRCARDRRAGSHNAAPLARLVFHVLKDRTAVFAIAKDGSVRGSVRSIGRDSLTHRVAELRDALGVDAVGRGVTVNGRRIAASNAYRTTLRNLDRDLIAPVAGAFPDGETIVIEPHGALWLVPFAALEDERGTAVVERWPIIYAPSDSILNEIRNEQPYELPQDLKALIIGNPAQPNLTLSSDARFRNATLRSTFSALPGAEEEAKKIAALLPADKQATLLTGKAADLQSVESNMRSHTLIHLASHALALSQTPLDSFVMLASNSGNDGRLTAARVLNLTVSADLVTLSACQTGMGYLSGDGVIGLSRAFLVRGARSVLVSQWSISDEATSALMQSFYSRYVGGTDDKAHALQRAIREVRSKSEFAHPKYWAPFVLIGSEE